MIKASSAVPDANGIARSGVTVSLANKHLVGQFLQKGQTLALDGLANDLKAKVVKSIAQPLAVITSKCILGTFSMTWANGVATGWASAAFPTARDAIAFFKSFTSMASTLRLPKQVKVRLAGYDNGDTNGVKGNWHPPLKKVHLKEGHTKPEFVLHEARICTMEEAAVLQLRFVAMVSGLPSEMDEDGYHTCVPKARSSG